MSIKKRQITHYILIIISLLVSSVVYLLIYNEYFNAQKLSIIKEQIDNTNKFRKISGESAGNLIAAQTNLNKFITRGNKKFLDSFSICLNTVTKNLELLNNSELVKADSNLELSELHTPRFEKFKIAIDSISRLDIRPLKSESFQPQTFAFTDTVQQSEVVVQYSIDSATKKKFFHRFIDAFKGTPEVKRDTIFIETKYGLKFDTTRVKTDFDSIVQLVNNHYLGELNKYQEFVLKSNRKNSHLYQTYDNLIWTGIELMSIYGSAIDRYNTELLHQFQEQNSKVSSIRKFTTLGLILFIFIILILLLYYTKQSFKFEKELSESNQRIKEDLNFKSRLLGMLSHEVRSPLKIITIFIDKINRRTEDKSVKGYLDLISYTNNMLLIQSNQILEYTKNQYSPIVLNEVVFDLKEEIDNILAIFSPFMASKGNTIESELDIHAEVRVSADRVKIHQLFSNILGNANKFTENGWIKVHVKTTAVSDSVLLNVSISDNGSGISPTDIEQIFEPFYRGVISDKIDNIGAGLGLSLCKEIVSAFGGDIGVKSEPDKGTNVYFELKLKNEISPGR